MSQNFTANVAAQLVGALIAALVSALFYIWFDHYVHILGAGSQPKGSPGRKEYDDLRKSLGKGGTPARIYADWLTRTLEAVEVFFGDVGKADRPLFPHPFGLQKPAPLWTAPAFDRCILLAFVYPILTIFFVWQVSGHVGPAEAALGIPPSLPVWQRAASILAFVASALCYREFRRCKIWTNSIMWILFAVVFALGVAAAVASDNPGAIAGSVGVTSAVVGAFAGDAVVAGVGALAGAVVGPIVYSFAGAVAGPGAAAVTIVLAGAMIRRTHIANRRDRKGGWLSLFLVITIVACVGAAGILSRSEAWPAAGPLLLFFGLLSLLNAPFAWFSLGLTRALLWRGLERENWWPYFYALVDAALAVLVVVLSAIVMVIGVQTFDLMAVAGGGKPVLPLVPLFDGIASNAAAPEYWWVYAMLLSTMIPSLVNLTIGGFSLMRGVPLLSAYLYKRMPVARAVAEHNRFWIAAVLVFQGLIGVVLGVAAQAFLVLLIFRQVLPVLGLDVLGLARRVADLDLPGRIFGLF